MHKNSITQQKHIKFTTTYDISLPHSSYTSKRLIEVKFQTKHVT